MCKAKGFRYTIRWVSGTENSARKLSLTIDSDVVLSLVSVIYTVSFG